MTDRVPVLRDIAYCFPRRSLSVAELGRRGLLKSAPSLLEDFGFRAVHVAETESPYELAACACRLLMGRTGVDPESVGLLVWGGPQGPTAFRNAPSAEESSEAHRTTARFRFPASRLQHELGLLRAQTLGVDQLACTTLFGAVRIARALCMAEGVARAICVSSEFFPADAGREAVFNCTSDAAVAVLVERRGERNRLRAGTQVTKGYYWNPDAVRNELVAAYFPTASEVVERTLAAAGWGPESVDWVIPHNVSARSWEVLRRLLRLPQARLWSANLGRDGHTLAGDNFINLADALTAGAVRAGQRLLLFSFGYGAHWTALAVEA